MKVKSLSHVRLLATPWTVAHQAPQSMGFSRQESWSGVPSPPPIIYTYIYICIYMYACIYIYIDVYICMYIVGVQATSWTATHQVFLFSTIFWHLFILMLIDLVRLSNHLFLCHPLLLLPSIFTSIRVFSQ